MPYITKLATSVTRWMKIDSERGVTAIEYGILASLIALAIIVAVTLVGTNLSTVFNNIANRLVPPG
jgi:pilus assembly protein Flp/PilA